MSTVPFGPVVQQNDWQTTIPTRTGWWDMRCSETGQKEEHVEIADRKGALWVNCPDLGWNPLDHYHGNLSDISWRWSLIQERVYKRGDLVTHVRLKHLGQGEIVDIRGEDGQFGPTSYDVMWFGIGTRLDKYDARELKMSRES